VFLLIVSFTLINVNTEITLMTLLTAFKFELTDAKLIWNMHMIATPSIEGITGSQLPIKLTAL
jgi:hypothetical protein